MTSIIHTVWGWSEETMNKLNPETDKHAYAKEFGLGAVEGSIAAVFCYLTLCYYWKGKAEKK